ncbi:MAG: hypothetical protein ACTSUB_01005, partial [Candidatus Thorarchaeota archaeon]
NDSRDHAPIDDKFWIEGQATYWGIESTKANYNLTNEEIQDEFDRVGDHNWYDHYTDLNRSVFKGWGGYYDDYMGSYLLMKFLAEKYGEEKLKEAFDKTIDAKNNSRDVSPQDALAEVLEKTWEEIVADFHAWMMTDAISDNGVPERTGNVEVTYSNGTVSDSALTAGWGAMVERIKVNSTQPFKITLDTPEGSKWRITVIYVYDDGTREQCPGTPYEHGPSYPHWAVNPGANGKKIVEVILVKSLVQDGAARINMTVTPIPFPGPRQITPNGGPIPWELPPGLLNGSILDWPWFWIWEIDFVDDLYEREIIINATSIVPDSFFDVFIELDDVIIYEDLNVLANPDELLIIDFAPIGSDWDFGIYNLTIIQSTWTSIINGTIELIATPREGATFEHPEVIMEEEMKELNSTLWRTGECQYFQLLTINDFEYTFLLDVPLEFEETADWYMELYNSTNYLLDTTSGLYALGEWPRTLEVPAVFDSDSDLEGIYILRVVYNGTGIGQITVLIEDAPGATMGNPLWHNFQATEYIGYPMPFTTLGGGALYINMSVTASTGYAIYFNSSDPGLTVNVWMGSGSYAFVYDAVNDWYEYFFMASETEYICIEILPNNPNEFVYFMWSELIIG